MGEEGGGGEEGGKGSKGGVRRRRDKGEKDSWERGGGASRDDESRCAASASTVRAKTATGSTATAAAAAAAAAMAADSAAVGRRATAAAAASGAGGATAGVVGREFTPPEGGNCLSNSWDLPTAVSTDSAQVGGAWQAAGQAARVLLRRVVSAAITRCDVRDGRRVTSRCDDHLKPLSEGTPRLSVGGVLGELLLLANGARLLCRFAPLQLRVDFPVSGRSIERPADCS